jgi:proteasome lid subunit RPN8/RPN11
MVHNHPSGDPSPSEADMRLTRRILEGSRKLIPWSSGCRIYGISGSQDFDDFARNGRSTPPAGFRQEQDEFVFGL